MGQNVFVLTSLIDNNEWRPVAVVTDEHVAAQWIKEGKDNDWIPFELNDVSTTSMSKGNITPFRPNKTNPTAQVMRDTIANLQTANKDLQEIVQELTDRLTALSKRKRGTGNPLLQKEE